MDPEWRELQCTIVDIDTASPPPPPTQQSTERKQEDEEHKKVWWTCPYCNNTWCKPATHSTTTGCPYCWSHNCPADNKSEQSEQAQRNVFLACEERQARNKAAAALLEQRKQHEQGIAFAERRAKLQVVVRLLNRVVLDIVDANDQDKIEGIRLVVGQQLEKQGGRPFFWDSPRVYYMSPVTGDLITEQEWDLKRDENERQEEDEEEEGNGVDGGGHLDDRPRAGRVLTTTMEVLENETHKLLTSPMFAELMTEWITQVNKNILWSRGLFVMRMPQTPYSPNTPYILRIYKWWKWWLV